MDKGKLKKWGVIFGILLACAVLIVLAVHTPLVVMITQVREVLTYFSTTILVFVAALLGGLVSAIMLR